MKISKRLQAIADMIPNRSRVVDVGCDHALLDIYLAMNKECHCVAADINKNALEQAKYNIKRFGVKNILTIQTDGISGIEVNEDDIVVISGMGATTIEHILKSNEATNTLIISAHNDWEFLRNVVVSLGYKIAEEKFIIDKNKGYIIIKFIRGDATYHDDDLVYGPCLKNDLKYLEYSYGKLKEVYDKIPENTEDKECKKKQLSELQLLIEKLI